MLTISCFRKVNERCFLKFNVILKKRSYGSFYSITGKFYAFGNPGA